jgi:hypothetical protein
MSKQQDDLLARELGKVGSLGGKIGGGATAALGGSLGARLAAQFLPTEQYQKQVSVSGDVAAVLTQLCSFFAAQGRIADEREAGTSQFPKISCVMGSGFLKLNPTLVHVEVVAVDSGSCTLLVSAAAKEGLIKQRSAEKAVTRVLEFLDCVPVTGD